MFGKKLNVSLLKLTLWFRRESAGQWIMNKTPSGEKPTVNTLRSIQNSRHFPDDILKGIHLNENVRISPKVSLNFVPKFELKTFHHYFMMALHRQGDKPLSELMMDNSLMHICVTRQWTQYIISIKTTNISDCKFDTKKPGSTEKRVVRHNNVSFVTQMPDTKCPTHHISIDIAIIKYTFIEIIFPILFQSFVLTNPCTHKSKRNCHCQNRTAADSGGPRPTMDSMRNFVIRLNNSGASLSVGHLESGQRYTYADSTGKVEDWFSS